MALEKVCRWCDKVALDNAKYVCPDKKIVDVYNETCEKWSCGNIR